MIESIISQMKRYADESDKELKEDLAVQALGIDSEERLKIKVDHFQEMSVRLEYYWTEVLVTVCIIVRTFRMEQFRKKLN